MLLSVPYDDALLLCGGLRLVEGAVSYGIHMAEAENNRKSNIPWKLKGDRGFEGTETFDETHAVNGNRN